MLWLVALQAMGSSNGEIPAAPGLLHIEEAAQRATEIKEGMEVELTSRVSCAGAPALVIPIKTSPPSLSPSLSPPHCKARRPRNHPLLDIAGIADTAGIGAEPWDAIKPRLLAD